MNSVAEERGKALGGVGMRLKLPPNLNSANTT
jgi:hypothetical protein